jgi:hypothetical protein
MNPRRLHNDTTLSIDSTGFSGARSAKKRGAQYSDATQRSQWQPRTQAAAPRSAPLFHSRTAMMHDARRCALSWSVLRREFPSTSSKNRD